MGQKLYNQDETGIKFSSERKPGEVRIPNYVYDIWLPILGSDALAVYAVYCRLEMKGAVKKIKLVDIARACRIGKIKLGKLNDKLEDCGFIKINKPVGAARLMHWTTEVVVLDPPRKVAQKLINRYAPNYEILTPWLLGDEDQIDPPEDPNRPSGEPDQAPPESPDQPPNIESLGSLQPLDVEKESPHTPQDFGIGQADPLDGVPVATDGHQRAVDKGNGGKRLNQVEEVTKHHYRGYMGDQSVNLPSKKRERAIWMKTGERLLNFIPEPWDIQIVLMRIDQWWGDPELSGFWKENPSSDKALIVIAKYIKNGGKSNKARKQRQGRDSKDEYTNLMLQEGMARITAAMENEQ